MMEYTRLAIIYLTTDEKELHISFTVGWLVEDLCIKICKQLNIGPVARHLFGLRNHSTKCWYPANHKLENKDKNKFDFRLRFKPTDLQRLKDVDKKAYDYYFQQARSDVMENKVPDIVYERHKRELIGLGVSDMYRVMLEKKIPKEIVESDYKKYIPKECIKRHAFFIKKPIHNALGRISGHDAWYVKEQYLKQFESMAPNYPYEEYKALMDKGITYPPSKVLLRVNVDEIKYCETDSDAWNILCAIEDLCFISIRQDNTVEISRKNGIPSYLKFVSNLLLMSFVSALDGYYRLAIKWTFNLCRDVTTPSLERLHKLRCHGPVGRDFSYGKLEEKRASRPGTYLLRESETEYNVFYIDVCGKDGNIQTQRIEELPSHEFIIPDSIHRYKSLGHFVTSFQNPEDQFYFAECLPPSEYDKSPLLICAPENIGSDVAADEEIITSLLESGPRCVPRDQLQIYKAITRSNEHLNIRSSSTKLHRAMWRVAKGKKLEIVVKILKEEDVRFTKEFLELAGKWSQLRSGALVRLYGLTVTPVVGMIMELVKLGPLDAYLRSMSPQTIKTVDMVEAAACLATALWHLEENGIIHGNIRCKKLLLHVHTDNSFIVKLTDPGLFTYTKADIHWLPPEFYDNLNSAKYSFQTDVWAVGTTIWQIFSRGAEPPSYHDLDIVKKCYQSGKRLPIPNSCPSEVYKLMTECWGDQNNSRKQPQAIMRDINQILYQVYNSRRTHAYATAFPKLFKDSVRTDKDESDTLDTKSINSESHASSHFTEHTSLPWDDQDDNARDLINIEDTGNYTDSANKDFTDELSWLTDTAKNLKSYNAHTITNALNCTNHMPHILRITCNDRLNSIIKNNNNCGNGSDDANRLQNIFELNVDCTVILQGRIGQGFYGEVYKGILEKDTGKDAEPIQVAVKKLNVAGSESDLQDFEREISIMKTLRHPNVVEILGVTSDPDVCIVMEFIKHGSLQSYVTIHQQTLTHKKLLGFALDIVIGMEFLGRMSVVHRDLAARNILVADENRVKISDFGLAQVTGSNDYYMIRTNRSFPVQWYAPESLKLGKFSPRSDVWSFGVTMYETFGLGVDPKLSESVLNFKSAETAIVLELPETAVALELPETAVAPKLPETDVAPKLPETAVAPKLPETATAPKLPESATAPKLSETAVASKQANGRGNNGPVVINDEVCNQLIKAYTRGFRLPCPPTCPLNIYVKLMRPCWEFESHNRPDFAALHKDIEELLSQYS